MSTLQEQLAAKKAEPEKKEAKQFRVEGFAYQFKFDNLRYLKPDVFGVYHPETKEEAAYLEHQVKCGRISFK